MCLHRTLSEKDFGALPILVSVIPDQLNAAAFLSMLYVIILTAYTLRSLVQIFAFVEVAAVRSAPLWSRPFTIQAYNEFICSTDGKDHLACRRSERYQTRRVESFTNRCSRTTSIRLRDREDHLCKCEYHW